MTVELALDIPFRLDSTLECGQLFRWHKEGSWWYGVVGDNVIKVRQDDELLTVDSNTDPNITFLQHYFRLDDDLSSILLNINKDEEITNAIHRFRGLRIVRQTPWECLISYICSAFSNIPMIRQMINNISKKFGQKILFEGKEYYTFPDPSTLANCELNELKDCSLGFRARSVLDTARMISSGYISLDILRKLNYEDALKVLIGKNESGKVFRGVGMKVADCVLLFSCDMLDAFPTDVWIKRVVTQSYSHLFDHDFVDRLISNSGSNSLSTIDYRMISRTMRNYFGKYAGYAQEYLYFHTRTKRRP